MHWVEWTRLYYAEPLKLIEYVVLNDRPYSEIVTLDKTMMTEMGPQLWAGVEDGFDLERARVAAAGLHRRAPHGRHLVDQRLASAQHLGAAQLPPSSGGGRRQLAHLYELLRSGHPPGHGRPDGQRRGR